MKRMIFAILIIAITSCTKTSLVVSKNIKPDVSFTWSWYWGLTVIDIQTLNAPTTMNYTFELTWYNSEYINPANGSDTGVANYTINVPANIKYYEFRDSGKIFTDMKITNIKLVNYKPN